MKIINVPHPGLRQTAQPVETTDQKLLKLLKELGETLLNHKNPSGVGLAAPQVNVSKRVFVTNVTEENQPPRLKFFINPNLVDHSSELILGPHPKDEILEGCLSIPGLYGPVPRYAWVDLEYQIVEGDKLLAQGTRFEGYEARVVQHELDHLNGVLFTDYSLEYDLPVYQENRRTKKFEEIDKRILETF